MNKCIVCECASVLYYQPPQERPPVVCPNCGRDTRRYPSLKADDPRVNRLVSDYQSRFMQDEKIDESEKAVEEDSVARRSASEVPVTGNCAMEEPITGRSTDEESAVGNLVGERSAAGEVVNEEVTGERFAEENPVRERTASGKKAKIYCLVSADRSYKIKIPENGGVIGRTATGAEELAHNGKISREHIRVMPVKRAEGIMVEDISANGTFLNGKRLTAQKQEFVLVGSEIKLFNEAFTLEVDDEQ